MLREMPDGACVSYDTGRSPALELTVIFFKRVGRQSQAVKPPAVCFKRMVAFAQAVFGLRVQVMAPEERGPFSRRDSDAPHVIFAATLFPSHLFRADPYLGRRSGRASRRIFLQLFGW